MSWNCRYVRFDDFDGREQMRMLRVEHRNRTQAADARLLIDCGRASRRTRGVPLLFLFEIAAPPLDRLFLF